jgi:toxin CcdB
MARFDVHRTGDGTLVLDCQADMLASLHTRVVAPLFPPEIEPRVSERLNPVLQIHGEGYVLYPPFIAAVSAEELGAPVTSLAREDMRILSALDMLMSGF